MDFSIGDVVQLKSGGQKMTIESIDDDKAVCIWSDGKKNMRDTIALAALGRSDAIDRILADIREAEKRAAIPRLNINFLNEKGEAIDTLQSASQEE